MRAKVGENVRVRMTCRFCTRVYSVYGRDKLKERVGNNYFKEEMERIRL